MEVKQIFAEEFKKYGKILNEYPLDELIKEMEKTPLPDDVIYIPSEQRLETTKVANELKNYGFGGIPIQIGYCNGKNNKLNALEYHRNSEINIAVTDCILLLGKQEDITEDFTYDTSKIEAFFVPKNTAVELYATTLHYAPCSANESGFKCIVVLPAGTNTELSFPAGDRGEARLMIATNKWLIAHKEANITGAYCGLVGKNITL